MKKIYIPQGGGRDFWLRIPMNNESAGRHLCMDDVDKNDMHVWLESGYGGCWTLVWEKDGAQRDGIAAKVPASFLGYGTYSVVMAGKFVNGDYFRTKRQLFIRLVDREDQADAEPTMYNEEQAYWAGPAVLSEMLSRDGLNTYELWILQGNEGSLEDYLSVSGLTLNDFMVQWNHLSVDVQSRIDRAEQTSINPKGDYDEEVEYHANDLVYDSETLSSYVSLLSHNTGNPVTDTTYWMKVLDGDDINQIKQDAEDEIDDALRDARTATTNAVSATTAAEAVVAQKVADAQIGYYECNTAAGTATKATTTNTIGQSTFAVPVKGCIVKIKMSNANTATDTVYLQFGSDANTKKELKYNGLAVDASNSWEDGETISVFYDGTYYQASNAQGGSNKKIDAYLYGDLRTLAVGQVYEENEAVKTSDKQLLRVTKEVKAMNITDGIAVGDLKIYGTGANASTYKAQKAVEVYNGTETEGLYAIGRPSLVTITVDSSSLTIEEDTDISVTIGGVTQTVTVSAAASETKDADIAALIAAAFTSIEGWVLTDNENGTLTLKCNTAGNNTISVSSNTGETGLSITSSAANGNTTLNQYNNGSWGDVTLAAYAGDYADIGVTDNTKMWQKLSIDALISFATVQNTLVNAAKAESISYDNSQSNFASNNVQGALDEVSVFGDKCINSKDSELQLFAQRGLWNADNGSIGTKDAIRANLKIAAKGYNRINIIIPGDYYAQFYYVNNSNVSQGRIGDWYSGNVTLNLSGEWDIMLNIKYQEAGSIKITSAMLNYVVWYTTLSLVGGFLPATLHDEYSAFRNNIVSNLSSTKTLTQNDFVQGSNDASGEKVANTWRCISSLWYDVDENTLLIVHNNGQAHVVLTFYDDVLSTTGWVTKDKVYTFDKACSVKVLVSWNGGVTRTIIPEQILATFQFIYKYDVVRDLDSNMQEIAGRNINGNRFDFTQGTNNAEGEIAPDSTTRCITLYKFDVDDNTILTINNNGQAHVMLTYDEDGVYESTTGWVKEDGSHKYKFSSNKKVRILASWDGGVIRTITPKEVAITFNIHTLGKIDNISGTSISEANDSFCRFNKKISVYNPYKDHPNNQYKGQMHCHTTNSDGALAPAAVVAKYVGYGYDFMTITDHNYITPNPSPNADIVWMGNSYEDTWNAAGHQHMNVWNCAEVINKVNQYTTSNTPLMLVNHYVKNGNSVLSYNHPEYPVVYASDVTLGGLPSGISFVEIYNSTIQTYLGEVDSLPTTANFGDIVTYNNTRYINTSITKDSPNWQATTEEDNPDGNLDRGFRIMLDNGHKVFCDAVDDFHRGDNMENRGWQMVFAHSRTKQSIWNGLLMGASYASTGVSLNDVSFLDGVFKLDIADGANAVTTFYGYNNEVLGTVNGATAMYEVTGDEKYVRAMVVIDGKKAWTQPVWIIAIGEQYEF